MCDRRLGRDSAPTARCAPRLAQAQQLREKRAAAKEAAAEAAAVREELSDEMQSAKQAAKRAWHARKEAEGKQREAVKVRERQTSQPPPSHPTDAPRMCPAPGIAPRPLPSRPPL